MNICFVHEEYPEETNFGGIATYQKNVAEELAKEHNVYVICRGLKECRQYEENGVKIYRVFVPNSGNQIKNYKNYRKEVAKILINLQESGLIDIIEVPEWGAETYFFEKQRKVPLVVRLHTPLKVWLKYNKNNFGNVKRSLLMWEKKMILSADLITCCSKALKNVVVNEFPIDKNSILVTPNPANIVNFYRDNSVKKKKKIIFVGSLEERKGVCVLAKSLNIVFKKYPNLKIDFVGKDTNRNIKNISTIEFIKNIIDEKYHKNIRFVGQIPNYEVNKFLNESMVAIFPSLFDNFPYVVLEAMATGIHIVGSRNSGMVEMLDDESSIYDTGDFENLAQKIMDNYELALIKETNEKNIDRLNTEYKPDKLCKELLELYSNTIRNYKLRSMTKDILDNVIKNVDNDTVEKFKIEKGGVANQVYRVVTKKSTTYIVKRYLYDYDFDLCNKLYNVYINNNINVIKPINSKPLFFEGFNYNVFEYKKKLNKKIIDFEIFEKLLLCEREWLSIPKKLNSIVSNKINMYYNYLSSLENDEFRIPLDDVNEVLSTYKNIMNNRMFNDEKFLNHGDISYKNILISKGKEYLIDFDETCITTKLYDFAVIVIKNFVNKDNLNMELYIKFKNRILEKFNKYSGDDLDLAIKYYLCKILLEKFYLHQKGIIDLYSKKQLKDNYGKYLKIMQTYFKVEE